MEAKRKKNIFTFYSFVSIFTLFTLLFLFLSFLPTMLESIVFIISIVISVILHEFAHGYVSYKLWDPTPKIDWRLSLDPRNHINKLWFWLMILLILLQAIWYWWGFGIQALWMAVAVLFAKPVLINPSYYRNPLRDKMLVAIAWPVTNFLLAILSILLIFFFASLFWYNQQPMEFNWIFYFFHTFAILNIILWAFNLLPVPPLDGFSVLAYFFPSLVFKFKKYNHNMTLQLIFLFIVLWPWSGIISIYLWFIVNWFYNFFYTILASVFY